MKRISVLVVTLVATAALADNHEKKDGHGHAAKPAAHAMKKGHAAKPADAMAPAAKPADAMAPAAAASPAKK